MGKVRPVAAMAAATSQHRFLLAAARLAEVKIELLDLERFQPKECLTRRWHPDERGPADSSATVDGHSCWEQGWDYGGPEESPGPRPWWDPLEVARRPNYCAPCLEAVQTWERRGRLRRSMGGHVRSLVATFKEWRANQ